MIAVLRQTLSFHPLSSSASRSLRLFSSELDDLLAKVLSTSTNTGKDALHKQPKAEKSNRWRTIDWKARMNHTSTSSQQQSPPLPSIVESIVVQDRIVYIKRDDQLRLAGSQISGNKARKMLALNELLDDDDHDQENELFPKCIVSFGGPQSNAMVALAAIVHFRNQKQQQQQQQQQQQNSPNNNNNSNNDPFRFVYYTKKLPRFLRTQPSGNLFRAQMLGMEMRELSHQEYSDLFGSDWGGIGEPPQTLEPPVPGDSLWVPQGGACGVALAGARRLAEEVLEYWKSNGRGRPLTVCLPGGTCSTAVLFHGFIQELNASLGLDIQVVVVPCVGDEFYSKRQMMALNAELGFSGYGIPTILSPVPEDVMYHRHYPNVKNEYFLFGQPDAQILETYERMKDEHQLVLDLLYGAPSWNIILRHLKWSKQMSHSSDSTFDPRFPLSGRCVLYIHSGGLEGINTQLLRYKYKGLVDKVDVQVPGKKL